MHTKLDIYVFFFNVLLHKQLLVLIITLVHQEQTVSILKGISLAQTTKTKYIQVKL